MREVARKETQSPRETRAAAPTPAPAPGASPRRAGPTPAQALALQRSSGNRAAARMLARWVKHPDPEKKGVMVADSSAAAFNYFNPPQNK